MSSDQTWAEALKISPESLSDWSTQAPSGTPLLIWCMTQGHVNSQDYLEWACDHFGIAILDSSFFKEGFKPESLPEFSDRTQWSAWCFPVAKWDDVLFLACAEPPSDLPAGQFAFLLADPAAMSEVWGTDKPAAEPAALDAPMGINPNVTRTFVLNLDDAVMGEHSEVVDPHPVPKEEKTGLTLSVVMDSVEATKAGIKPIAKAPAPPPAPAAAKPAATAKPAPTASKPAAAAPVAPAPKKPALNLAVNEGTPPPAPAPKARPGAAAVNEDSEVQAAFSRLHDHYQSSLLMRCVEGSAKPYKWDPSLPITAGEEKFNVNLGFPSFFRIVSKTAQPYHGYVIDSPAHREFFANLNFENPPACVTAIPLKAGDKMWGMLVAFGGEAAQTPEALNEALAVSEKLTLAFGAAWADRAA